MKKMKKMTLKRGTGDETYRGWKNFQTWAIDSWLRYDSDSLARLYEGAKSSGDRQTFSKSLKEALRAEARELLEAGDLAPTARGIFGDLLGRSLDCADFEEIADHVFEEIEGDEIEGEETDGEEAEESRGEGTEPATLADLREAHRLAVERGEASFVIDGMEFQTFLAECILNFSERYDVPDTTSLREMIQKGEW